MKPKVLVVDDDEALTKQLFWTLCDEYDVITANDLNTAVMRAATYVPDVSLLDLRMPPNEKSLDTGLRLLEFIKVHVPESKVLVITAAGGIETRKACLALGADGFLAKPFDPQQLLTAMRRVTFTELNAI